MITNPQVSGTSDSGGTRKVLVDLRPAFDGYAGIPQESRLLYWGLNQLGGVAVTGMLSRTEKIIGPGVNRIDLEKNRRHPLDKMSRTVISMTPEGDEPAIKKRMSSSRWNLLYGIYLGVRARIGLALPLKQFVSVGFEDFVWRSLFSKTLPAREFKKMSSASFAVLRDPWRSLHWAGMTGRKLGLNRYTAIETRQYDFLLVHTPYPVRCSRRTQMIIRYHDAVPIFLPHTINQRSYHQASHFHALKSAVKHGAEFACVSRASETDLLRVFPELQGRTKVIHNMVSHHYFSEDSSPSRVPDIIRARIAPANEPQFLTSRERENFYKRHLPDKKSSYLLMVSTLEPRKNHSRLLAAWEYIRAQENLNLKLVIVGSVGWGADDVLRAFRPWQMRGELFHLERVPSADLRVLYRHAAATVCPSVAEGFDYSGVEAMRSGGVVAASDIPVHREVYDDASAYFDPYSTRSLAENLTALVSDHSLREHALQRGQVVAQRYLPEAILPKWRQYLEDLAVRS